MFKKKLRDMIKDMGLPEESIDDEMLDMLQKQLFQLLEHEENLMGGISFKTGSIMTNITLANYADIREEIRSTINQGRPIKKLDLKLRLTTMCLYLDPEFNCSITSDTCPFKTNNHWWECEIVQTSCETDLDQWK